MKTLETLVPKLLSATQEGRLKWQTAPDGSFEAFLANATLLQVVAWTDEDTGLTGVSLVLRAQTGSQSSPRGSELDRTSSSEMDGDADLYKLISAARRSANNIDKVISEIESILGPGLF